MGLPLFTALIMADPVIRDFRLVIDPLIFSKPISRGSYLLGKFFGNFFVLVCCQAAFAITLILMQVFHTSQMIVLPLRVLPYFKHFFFFLVISHLVLAAVYFSVATLTRNAKIAYWLAVSFYPLYIAYSILLKGLPMRWRIALDPVLFTWVDLVTSGVDTPSPAWFDQLVISYNADMVANRGFMILIAAVCLTVLCLRFALTARPRKEEAFSLLNLSTGVDTVYYDSESFQATAGARHEVPQIPSKVILPSVTAASHPQNEKAESHEKVILPSVTISREGFRSTLKKLIGALSVEFRLLRTERSLVILMPLAIFFSILQPALYKVFPDVSYSAAYASSTAKALLLFLLGMTVFYTGEAMHRERDLRIEPVLWSLPAPNSVFLLSKFLATLLLTFSLIVLAGLTAMAVQIIKGDTPVDFSAYVITGSVILLPSIIFMAAISLALNVLLRDKYLAYAVSVGIAAGLFYLYGQGYNHWLYNPVLYQLWNYGDLTDAGIHKILQ